MSTTSSGRYSNPICSTAAKASSDQSTPTAIRIIVLPFELGTEFIVDDTQHIVVHKREGTRIYPSRLPITLSTGSFPFVKWAVPIDHGLTIFGLERPSTDLRRGAPLHAPILCQQAPR